jgi:nitrite reductase/ring-hydroxylating ferredoxin subunit/uncharacterized membrane protein
MNTRSPQLAHSLDRVVARIGQSEQLDVVARPVADTISEKRPEALTGLLSGTWLGHPLHPLLTDVTIGCWTSAWFLDLLGGRQSRTAARRLVALGVLSAIPTVATGVSDWSDTVGETRRIGLVHALTNTAGLTFYTCSWWARKRGHHGTGVMLGWIGATAATAAAFLGGHLVYRTGTGVDENAFTEPADDWRRVDDEHTPVADVPDAFAARAGDEMVLITRDGDGWHSIGDRCTHRGGPLHEGTIADGVVTCPWHGSRFRIDDGTVVRGPATSPVRRYEVREQVDGLYVRVAPPSV